MAHQKILVITGPTASGKSDLAVRLAKKFDGEIISADSRQVYKGLDVGTGKITKEEMQGIPHHLLGVADPKERFTASDFVEQAKQAINRIHLINKLPIVVGGTGFYISALAEMTSLPNVAPNPKLRKNLEKKNAEELFEMLKEKDPRRAKSIDPKNKVRLVRALEIVEKLGKVPTQKSADSPYEFVYIGLKPDDKTLEERIRTRLEKRMPDMLEEAKRLHSEGLSYERMRELGLEYKFLAMHLEGELSLEEMKEKLYTAIRQYSKRQMTWFKKNEKIKWFKPEKYEEIERYTRDMLG